MKKLVSILVLFTLGPCTTQLHCMEEREQPREEEAKEQDVFDVTITYNDGTSSLINHSLFEQLKRHSNMIAHVCADTTEKTETLNLNNLTREAMEDILIARDTLTLLEDKQQYNYISKVYISEESQKPLSHLVRLSNAANYLDIPILLDLLIKTIAHKIIREINQISSENFSQKIIKWFDQNKHDLQRLPNELIVAITKNIVNQLSLFVLNSVLAKDRYNITHLAMNPNPKSSSFASVYNYDSIDIWTFDPSTSTWRSAQLQLAPCYVAKFAWNPNGYSFICMYDKISVFEWDKLQNKWESFSSKQNKCESFSERIRKHITCFEWNPDGSSFISGYRNEIIVIWNKSKNQWRCLEEPIRCKSPITCLAWHPDGSSFISASADQTIRVWERDKSNQWQSQELAGHTKRITHLSWNPNGSSFISASDDLTIRVWERDKSNQWQSQELTGHTKSITHLSWNPDRSSFISVSYDDTVRIGTFDPSNNQWLSKELTGRISHFAWNHNGSFISTYYDQLCIWKWNHSTHQWQPQEFTSSRLAMRSLALNTDGSSFISTSLNGTTIRIWALPPPNLTLEQVLLILIWQHAKQTNVAFKVPQELQEHFDSFPEYFQHFLKTQLKATTTTTGIKEEEEEEEQQSSHRLF